MTKYLETKTNSIEEAISSVVKGEGFASDAQRRAAFAQGYKAKGKKDKNEEIDEGAGKYSKMNLDKAKKIMGPSKNREQGVKMVMKGLGTTYKHANQLVDKILGVNPKTGKIESAELGEGYESEVLKVLKDADIDGYFKMGKLYVSRRDAKDAKKALEDSDEITKLPKMVMEVYEIGTPEYTKHTLEVTPGQSVNDVDEMLGITQKKRTSMREALAKMWGLDEGKNPFKKSEEKDLTKEGEHDKTLTGKKPTTVDVDPELKDK